jgi:hypothetical protein
MHSLCAEHAAGLWGRQCVTPAGKVQLSDNSQVYGSALTVSSGIATFFATNLPVAAHSILEMYQGNANTLPSNSAPISQIVLGSVPLQITATSGSGVSHSADLTILVN